METQKTTIPIPGDRYWLKKGKYSGTYVEYREKIDGYYFSDVTEPHPFLFSKDRLIGLPGPFNFEPCE